MNDAWKYAPLVTKSAYLAGIIDGEGSILLTRRHSGEHRSPALTIPSTTPEILDWLKENFGGLIIKKKKTKEHHNQSWVWSLKGDAVLALLDDVEYLLVEPGKAKRAKVLLDEYKKVTVRNGKYSKEQLKSKRDFEKRFFE